MGRVTPFRQLNNRRVNGKTSHAMTMRLLRHRARLIESQEQFEAILAQATHPAEVRRLMEPMLQPNLPCCVPTVPRLHTEGCPTWKETHAEGSARQAPEASA